MEVMMKGQLLASFLASTALASSVYGVPVRAQSQLNSPISSLRDANHRLCSEPPNRGELKMSGMCFLFRKEGDEVIGQFFEPYTDNLICVHGVTDGMTVTGIAVSTPPLRSAPVRLEPEAKDFELGNWDNAGYLKVARGSVSNESIPVGEYTEYSATISYKAALLDIEDFYRYNAGTTLPPRSCEGE